MQHQRLCELATAAAAKQTATASPSQTTGHLNIGKVTPLTAQQKTVRELTRGFAFVG